MERKQFTFYRSYFEALKELPAGEQSEVLMAICSYALDGVEPELSGIAKAIFTLIRPTIDTGRRKAESGFAGGTGKGSEKQQESKPKANRKQGESKAKGNAKQTAREIEKEIEIEKDIETPPKGGVKAAMPPDARARRGGIPPTLEEVAAYVRERGSNVDPQGFIDFYASKGWKVGKSPMVDWKAACRGSEQWERWSRQSGQGQSAPRASPGGRNPQYRPEDFQPDEKRIMQNDQELRSFLHGNGQAVGEGGGRRGEMA